MRLNTINQGILYTQGRKTQENYNRLHWNKLIKNKWYIKNHKSREKEKHITRTIRNTIIINDFFRNNSS